MTATHDKQEFMADGVIVHLKSGQLFTGRKALSEATGIAQTTIERVLQTLESEHQIGQQKTSKYRVITILNWDKFQKRTEERTTNGQQTDTYKNVKNVKKIPANADFTIEEENPRKSNKDPLTPKYEALLVWAEQRRGFKFLYRKKQYGAMKTARLADIGPDRLKERWIECESKNWPDGFDWAGVMSTFDKKK